MTIIPQLFWVTKSQAEITLSSLFSYLFSDLKINLGALKRPRIMLLMIRIFRLVLFRNLTGLLPFVFTSSSHLTFTLTLGLIIWLTSIITILIKDLNYFLTHLVPSGTPFVLIPLIVLIETVRSVIRPITLSVRLAANIVAGHLLLSLIRGRAGLNLPLASFILIFLVLIVILETAVAVIQSYVISSLRRIYLGEVNTVNVW